MLYTKSGLLGFRPVERHAGSAVEGRANADAKRAIDLFVYRITREIGSLIAALGGLDGLVFTAGIGENDAATRAEVIAGLAWAGLPRRGRQPHRRPAASRIRPTAWVIPTNEELVIARQMRSVLAPRARLAS